MDDNQKTFFQKMAGALKCTFRAICTFLMYIFHKLAAGIKFLSRQTKGEKPYEARQNIFLICEIVVILICLCVMYIYIPLWTITIVVGYFTLLILAAILKLLLNSVRQSPKEKPKNQEGSIYSFHLKNASIGYWYYVMLILLSITFSIVTYCSIVDRQYHKIYEAYNNANVIRTALKNNAAFPDKNFEPNQSDDISYKRCLIELMREMKLLNADEYFDEDSEGKPDKSKLGDHPKAVLEILKISGNPELRPIQNGNDTNDVKPTVKYLYLFCQQLGERAKEAKLDGFPQILAAIFAQQPGVYDETLELFNPLKSQTKQDPSATDDQVDPDTAKEQVPSDNKGVADDDKSNQKKNTFGENQKTSDKEIDNFEHLVKNYEENYSIVNDQTRWTYFGIKDWFFKPAPITDELTLRLLYSVTGLHEKINMAKANENEADEKLLSRQDYYFIRNWCANLISMLHDNPEVKHQKMLLSVIHGPEQFGMLIVFFLSFLMMLGRLFMLCWNRIVFFTRPIIGSDSRFALLRQKDLSQDERKQLSEQMLTERELFIDGLYPALVNTYYAEGKDEETRDQDMVDQLDYTTSHLNALESRSRWLINWSAAALPSIGFIGTVRGLLLALGDADSIVRATTALGQAAAITSVATQLSLAFTTTLVALLLGLVLSLLNYWQVKAERNYLSLLDIALRNHFNVWGQVDKTKK